MIKRSWGYMLEHPNSTQSTFWEGYHKDGSFAYQTIYMSHAHGWATGPAAALSHNVLGIRPLPPKLSKSISGGVAGSDDDNRRLQHSYVVSPSPGDLSFCEGSLSFGNGRVELHWQVFDGGTPSHRFVMDLNASRHPTGAVAEIALPIPPAVGSSQLPVTCLRLRVDGILAWQAGHISDLTPALADAGVSVEGVVLVGDDVLVGRRLRALLRKPRLVRFELYLE